MGNINSNNAVPVKPSKRSKPKTEKQMQAELLFGGGTTKSAPKRKVVNKKTKQNEEEKKINNNSNDNLLDFINDAQSKPTKQQTKQQTVATDLLPFDLFSATKTDTTSNTTAAGTDNLMNDLLFGVPDKNSSSSNTDIALNTT